MKSTAFVLALFPVIAPFCGAQHITENLVLQYDMETLSSGEMLDLSGNGHNGTLVSSPPQTSLGTTFNGTTQLIALSPVINASLFYSVIYCGSSPDTVAFSNLGTIYAEYGTQATHIREYQISVGETATPPDISWPYDWQCFYFQRNQQSIFWGPLDVPGFRTSASLSDSLNTASFASVGAQQYGTSTYDTYYTGTLGYLEIYSTSTPDGLLTPLQLTQEYTWLATQLSARGIKLRPFTRPVYPSNVWTRLGNLPIPFIATPQAQEENQPGYTTTDCQYIANPCWQLVFDNGVFTYYTEAPVITGPWTAPVGILLDVDQTNWIKVGTTYHLYGTNGAATQINHYTGPNLASLTLANSTVIGLGEPGQFDSMHVYNPALNWDGSLLRMVYVGQGYANGQFGGFVCGVATSADFVNFTKYGSISSVSDSCQNPGTLTHMGLNWYFWSPGVGVFQRFSVPYSLFSSAMWQQTAPHTRATLSIPTFTGSAQDKSELIFDPRVFPNPTGPGTYLFYEGACAPSNLVLKYAWTPLSIPELLETGEGMSNYQMDAVDNRSLLGNCLREQ